MQNIDWNKVSKKIMGLLIYKGQESLYSNANKNRFTPFHPEHRDVFCLVPVFVNIRFYNNLDYRIYRGVHSLTAIFLLSRIGDYSRFANTGSFLCFIAPVPGRNFRVQ